MSIEFTDENVTYTVTATEDTIIKTAYRGDRVVATLSHDTDTNTSTVHWNAVNGTARPVTITTDSETYTNRDGSRTVYPFDGGDRTVYDWADALLASNAWVSN